MDVLDRIAIALIGLWLILRSQNSAGTKLTLVFGIAVIALVAIAEFDGRRNLELDFNTYDNAAPGAAPY